MRTNKEEIKRRLITRMAKFDFKQYTQRMKENAAEASENAGTKISYFALKDGEEALIRFDYTTLDEVDFYTTHTVKLDNGAYRSVSCIGDKNPEDCPFCSSEDPTVKAIHNKVFLKLIEYTTEAAHDQQKEQLVITPKIWERTVSFLNEKLAPYVEEYGDLNSILFKVKRSGQGLDTVYNLIPASERVYPATIYKLDFTGFKDFKLSNFYLLEKGAAEMQKFLETGSFKDPEGVSPIEVKTPAASIPAAVTPTESTEDDLEEDADEDEDIRELAPKAPAPADVYQPRRDTRTTPAATPATTAPVAQAPADPTVKDNKTIDPTSDRPRRHYIY